MRERQPDDPVPAAKTNEYDTALFYISDQRSERRRICAVRRLAATLIPRRCSDEGLPHALPKQRKQLTVA